MKQITIDISDDAEAGILAEIAGSRQPAQTVAEWMLGRLSQAIFDAERRYRKVTTAELTAKLAAMAPEDRAEVYALIDEKSVKPVVSEGEIR